MADSAFVIDGMSYEVPTLDSFTMSEAKILYRCSGLSLEDFAIDEDDPEASGKLQKNIRNPGFIEALMTVAYVRGNKGISEAKAASVIGQSNLVEALQTFVGSEDDADPPVPSEAPATEGSSVSPSDPSGDASMNGSDAPAKTPEPTGTSESDTSHISAPTLSDT